MFVCVCKLASNFKYLNIRERHVKRERRQHVGLLAIEVLSHSLLSRLLAKLSCSDNNLHNMSSAFTHPAFSLSALSLSALSLSALSPSHSQASLSTFPFLALTPPDLGRGTMSVVRGKSLCRSRKSLSWSITKTTSTGGKGSRCGRCQLARGGGLLLTCEGLSYVQQSLVALSIHPATRVDDTATCLS